MRERNPNTIGGGFFSMIVCGLAAWAILVYLIVNVVEPLFFPTEFGEKKSYIEMPFGPV